MPSTRLRKVWQHQHVVDATGPSYALRTYLEQSDIRSWLKHISHTVEIRSAADIGAGYGRLTPVLTEFAKQVVAFEREPHFVADIQQLLPHVYTRQVQTLAHLPVPASLFQCVLTFTVLQHLDDNEVIETVAELKRIIAAPGFVLLCEETDPALDYDDEDSPEGGITVGRSVADYRRLLAPLNLVATAPRRVEPGYHHAAGTYRLFQRM
jgi:SAM-dependent methyltransferase